MASAEELRGLLPRVLTPSACDEDVQQAIAAVADCPDPALLRRLLGAESTRLREAGIRRLLSLEPGDVEHHLALYQHFLSVQQLADAEQALDAAEALAPGELRVMRARLALHSRDEPAALLALAKRYLPRFGSDPILGMVIVRCEKAVAAAQTDGGEPTVVLPKPERRIEPPTTPSAPEGGGGEWLQPQRPDLRRIEEVLGRTPRREVDVRQKRQPPRRKRIVLPIQGPDPDPGS